jgi:hypothetical protein
VVFFQESFDGSHDCVHVAPPSVDRSAVRKPWAYSPPEIAKVEHSAPPEPLNACSRELKPARSVEFVPLIAVIEEEEVHGAPSCVLPSAVAGRGERVELAALATSARLASTSDALRWVRDGFARSCSMRESSDAPGLEAAAGAGVAVGAPWVAVATVPETTEPA